MPMPQAGDRAPDLRLQAPDGNLVDLSALSGGMVVVFFYAKAATPG
jgi:peroxiredoxin